jgi:hypothetical protein
MYVSISHLQHECYMSLYLILFQLITLAKSMTTTYEILFYVELSFFLLNSVTFSPQANYTDRVTASCRRSQCQLLRIEVLRGQRNGFLRPLISVFKIGAATFPFK